MLVCNEFMVILIAPPNKPESVRSSCAAPIKTVFINSIRVFYSNHYIDMMLLY